MARPMKKGLDYFTLDTADITRVELIEAEFGLMGYAIIVKLWQKIFGGEGYFYPFGPDERLLFMRQFGVSREELDKIIDACLAREVFSGRIFRECGVLTSEEIQTKYFAAVAKRASISVNPSFLLISTPDNAVSASETPVSASQSTQRRVEKRRAEKSTAEESTPRGTPGQARGDEAGGGGDAPEVPLPWEDKNCADVHIVVAADALGDGGCGGEDAPPDGQFEGRRRHAREDRDAAEDGAVLAPRHASKAHGAGQIRGNPGTAAAYCAAHLPGMSPGNHRELADFLRSGLTDALILHVVDDACARAKPTWAYVRMVLTRYRAGGIFTVAAAREDDLLFRQRGGGDPRVAALQRIIDGAVVDGAGKNVTYVTGMMAEEAHL